MPTKVRFSGNPETPVETFTQDYQQHEETEKDEGYEEHNVQSLCTACRFGFIFSCGASKWRKNPELVVYCTGPWLHDAMGTENVTNCNGYQSGDFDPTAYEIEKALKVDPDNTPTNRDESSTPVQQLDEVDEIEKALDKLEKEDKEEGREPNPGDETSTEKAFPLEPEEAKEKKEEKEEGGGPPEPPVAEPEKEENNEEKEEAKKEKEAEKE